MGKGFSLGIIGLGEDNWVFEVGEDGWFFFFFPSCGLVFTNLHGAHCGAYLRVGLWKFEDLDRSCLPIKLRVNVNILA